jgi:hypothetical protein
METSDEHPDDRSLKELLGDLTHSLTTLFGKEIELAKPRYRPRNLDLRGAPPAQKCRKHISASVLDGDLMELMISAAPSRG